MFLFLFVYILLFCPSLQADSPRMLETTSSFVEIYSQPADTAPPVFIARKGQCFPLYSSIADDSGRIWFSLNPGHGQIDTGWALARNLRYINISTNSLASFKLNISLKNKEKKHRYEELRKHPKWPRRIRRAIRKGEIVLHMTKEQLEASWGKPDREGKAFMVGVGNYRIFYYKQKNKKPMIEVTIQEKHVTGWTEK